MADPSRPRGAAIMHVPASMRRKCCASESVDITRPPCSVIGNLPPATSYLLPQALGNYRTEACARRSAELRGGEPLLGAGPPLRRLDLAVLRRRRRRELAEQLARRGGHGLHRALEGLG